MCEGYQVAITTPPTRTYRYSRAAESEMPEGDHVTKPNPLTRTDRYSGASESEV